LVATSMRPRTGVPLVVTGASATAVAASNRPMVLDLGTDMWETDVPQGPLPAYYNVQADHDEEFGKYFLANQGLALDTSCTACFGKGEVYPRRTLAYEACVTQPLTSSVQGMSSEQYKDWHYH
jgi:hypothetical protein